MMRSLIGELRASDVKSLDLKVGQVVKGMVLQLLANQEALVNINGFPVKAKLETPLSQGQTTMLQVQPESQNGQLVLKPLGSSQVQIENQSLDELLKSLGIKDQLPNRQLIQQMHQEGIPLNKENITRLLTINENIPKHIPSNQWIQAGTLAFQRGLPLTEQTLKALHQVLYGKPIHEALNQLQEQMKGWLLANAKPSISNQAASSSAYRLMLQLNDGLQQIQTLASQPQTNLIGNKAEQPIITANQSSQFSVSDRGSTAFQMSTTFSQSTVSSAPNASASPSQSAINSEVQPQNESGKQNITNQRQIDLGIQSLNSQNVKGKGLLNSNQQQLNDTKAANNGVDLSTLNKGTARLQGELPTWVSSVLKALGIEHEQQLLKILEKPELFSQRTQMEKLNLTADNIHDRISAELVRQTQYSPLDSMKSLLMQMQASDEFPLSMRENVQQLLQQITGQQLFLAADRSSQFSHMTLFIPLLDENGSQTAAINIQSRKGKRGEIDANNCRLLFDLNMKTLGAALVDVSITNKIISLQVHNDHPLISELLASSKEEMTAAFQQLGYHFSSVKCVPFPEKSVKDTNEQFNGNGVKASLYNSRPYKGVDIRV